MPAHSGKIYFMSFQIVLRCLLYFFFICFLFSLTVEFRTIFFVVYFTEQHGERIQDTGERKALAR